MMKFTHILCALGALSVAGCVAREIEVPLNHPANPLTLEAPSRPQSTTLKTEPQNGKQARGDDAPVSGHAHHHDGQPAGIASAYYCPMHTEVSSDKPGRCPKCGMQLTKGDRE